MHFYFILKTQLEEHKKIAHGSTDSVQNKKKCKSCDFEGTTDLEINLHHHQKHTINKIKCNLCDFRAINEDTLKKHYSVAMGHKNNIPCRYFIRGTCKYGKHCKFEHKNNQKPSSVQVGQSKVENFGQSRNAHQVSQKQCKFYDRCNNFPNCGFMHYEICKYQDQCNNLNNCKFVHLDFLGRVAFQWRGQ